jgi:uncharacterized protein
MEHKSLAIQDCNIKFAASEGAFSGYGSVFGNLDSKNDIIMPGAYDDVLKSGDPVHVYVNHGWLRGELPVGDWTGLKQDTKGLFGDANLVMQMPTALNAYWAMKSGLVSGLSIGFLPDPSSTERKNDGTRVIHKIKILKEISIVTDPANESSRVVSVKFREEIDQVLTVKDFEHFLRDAGDFSKGAAQALTAKAKALFGLRDAGEQVEAQQMAEILARIQKISQ